MGVCTGMAESNLILPYHLGPTAWTTVCEDCGWTLLCIYMFLCICSVHACSVCVFTEAQVWHWVSFLVAPHLFPEAGCLSWIQSLLMLMQPASLLSAFQRLDLELGHHSFLAFMIPLSCLCGMRFTFRAFSPPKWVVYKAQESLVGSRYVNFWDTLNRPSRRLVCHAHCSEFLV